MTGTEEETVVITKNELRRILALLEKAQKIISQSTAS
jgi:hypothetical protein